ncbi:MAG: F0F1 ATP synthase subunit A [Fimbriimonadaceae bacterium]|nr:F0F1 ATP synthase subunit A [Fimbriimonadaceae bacterium]
MDGLFQFAPMMFASAEGGEGAHHALGWPIFVYSGVIVTVIFALLAMARSGMTGKGVFRNPFTLMAEQAYLFVENMCLSVIGPHGRKYVPFILGLWLIIYFGNLMGLILPHTPTADWSLNVAMALVVLGYVQWEGIAGNYVEQRKKGRGVVMAAIMGFLLHVKHFAGPSLGVIGLVVTPLIFAIELISESIKVLSLSVRLYGNISAGHAAKAALDNMVTLGGFHVPLGAVIFPLEFLVALVQAFVFVLLSCVYIATVTAHGDDHHEEAHGHGDGHADSRLVHAS